ncbi:MAG: MFS transporter, partial [Propionibacteriaceae bacterium]|nr:MFS transporter [Propionibacteriaceae bacterium]
MASYIDAAALLTVAVAVVILQEPAGLTPMDIGVLTALLQACVAVGALVGGRLGDRVGRRPVFTKTMIMIIAGGLMMIMGQSFWWFIMAQILIGLGSGADLPVSLATVADFATDDNRARLIGFSWPLWTIGIVVVQGLASLVGNLGVMGAHIMFLHLVVVAAIVAVLRPFIPEPTLFSTTKAVESKAKPADLKPVSALQLLLKRPYVRPFVALLLFSALLGAAINANGTLFTYLMVNVVGIDVAFASQLGLIMIPWNLLWSFVFMRVA